MISENFIFVGSFLSLYGDLTYVIDTLKGKVQPNRVSWFFWGLAPLIAFSAQITQGVGVQSLLTFSVGCGPLLIFLASFFNKKAYWKLGRLDIICGLLSLTGLLLWSITRVGNVAIFFSIVADAIASIPTIIKSCAAPETENYNPYLFAAVGAGLTLLTINVWNFAHYGFPLYILINFSFLFILIKFRLGKTLSKNMHS